MAATGKASERILIVASAAFIATFAAVAASPFFALTAGLLVVLGVASVAFSTTINTTLQLVVPDELRGRVMSIFFLLFAGSTPIGGWFTGTLGESVGVPETLAIEAILCTVGFVIAVTYRWAHGRAMREAALARHAAAAD
jgi:MFS family permease